MNIESVVTIDFETEPIELRPAYPPKPVSVAIKYGSKKARFYSWDHPCGNNCTKKEAQQALRKAWTSKRHLLFQNAPFDVEVAHAHMGMSKLSGVPEIVHDTIWMMFLDDPHAPNYHLKESAERLLRRKPDERDAVVEWLVEHQPVAGVKLSPKPKSKNYAGKYICLAPGSLVGPYCIGDVDRTFAIAKKLWKKLQRKPHLLEAYRREQQMLPVIMRMEQHGVRVDVKALARDIAAYTRHLARIETWIKKKLKTKEINLDSGAELAEALIKSRNAKEKDFGTTPTGKLCTNKDALKTAIKDPQLTAALRWRGAVNTCLKTFLKPWHEQAKRNKGRIYIRWNSIRREDGASGARTGRLSSSPNLQNVPKSFKPLFWSKKVGSEGKISLPRAPVSGLPPPPLVRTYILPDKGHILIDRDFDSQELRMLGHYEDDDICYAYNKDATTDIHQKVADDLCIERQKAKTINFAILYGVGNGHLAEMLDCTVKEAKQIKDDYFYVYPSVKDLIADLKQCAKLNKPIRTWGGREYMCEPPKWIKGRMWDFSYKLLNYLIQGSSADYTKQAMIEFTALCASDVWLLASVHDELLVSCPRAKWKAVMATLKKVMNKSRLDVPMLSTGKVGSTFATMRKVA